jgi:hypothetical protein
MATLIENNLPYKLYSGTNLGANDGMFYLGKVPSNLNFSQKIFDDSYYNNCFSGYYFSIASLVPGNCIRMDIADGVDTNILIDAKWFDFRPCSATSCSNATWPIDNILHSVDNNNPMEVNPLIKSLTTDGSVVISGLESGYIWNDMGINDPSITSHCTIYLQAWKYKFANVCDYYPGTNGFGTYYATIGTPGVTDVTFLMKSLIGGKGIEVLDLGCQLKIVYTGKKVCEPNEKYPIPPITCEPYIPSNIGELI